MTSVHIAQMVDFLKGQLLLCDTRSEKYSDGVRAMVAKSIIVAHPQASLQGDGGVTYGIPYSIDALLGAIYPKRLNEKAVDLAALKNLLIEQEFVLTTGGESLVCTSIAFVRTIAAYRPLPGGGLAVFYARHHPDIGVN